MRSYTIGQSAISADFGQIALVRPLQTGWVMKAVTKTSKPARRTKPSVTSVIKNRKVVSQLGGVKAVAKILQSLADAIVP